MPRIDAPTVAEHRANVQARLVDAAEEILRSGPEQPLTAGAVSSAAGIARNSIYRYVDSVDDLRALVVNRYLPAWLAGVATAMATVSTPAERVVVWVEANLDQAASTGHGWLMDAARTVAPSAPLEESVGLAHAGMRDSLADAWRDLLGDDLDRVAVAAGITVGILEAGFRQLDSGRSSELVIEMGGQAARALVQALAPDSSA